MGPILGGTPYLRYTSAVKITCDGNSLTESYGTGTPYPTQLAALLGGVTAVANVGISGQITSAMTSAASDVEANYVAGKTNVLIAWEGINSLRLVSPRQAADDMWAYLAARLASHPDWLVMLITCPPRQLGDSEAEDIAFNAQINEYNVYLRDEYRAHGVKVLLDIRQAGSPWAFADYTRATFDASVAAGWWAAGEVNAHTHYSTQGYGSVAAQVQAALRRMPRR